MCQHLTLIDLYPDLTTHERYLGAKLQEMNLDDFEQRLDKANSDGYSDGYGDVEKDYYDEGVEQGLKTAIEAIEERRI